MSQLPDPHFLDNLSSPIWDATLIIYQTPVCGWSISGFPILSRIVCLCLMQQACLKRQVITCLLWKSNSQTVCSRRWLFLSLPLRFYKSNDRHSSILFLCLYLPVFTYIIPFYYFILKTFKPEEKVARIWRWTPVIPFTEVPQLLMSCLIALSEYVCLPGHWKIRHDALWLQTWCPYVPKCISTVDSRCSQ